MRFQGYLFLDTISWIFSLKKDYFVFLTVSLNIFQSELDLDKWYIFRFLLHSLFYQALKHLVILTNLEYLFQRFSKKVMNSCTILFSISLSEISVVSMLPTTFLSSLIKPSSSSLCLIIVHYLSQIDSSLIIISTIKRA